jgi:hypothetical protein
MDQITKNESLPEDMRYFDGRPPEVLRFGAAWPTATILLIDKPTEVAPGVRLIAQTGARIHFDVKASDWKEENDGDGPASVHLGAATSAQHQCTQDAGCLL